MSAAIPKGHTPYYFVPGPSRHPVMAAIGLFFVILGAGQWVNGAEWGPYSVPCTGRACTPCQSWATWSTSSCGLISRACGHRWRQAPLAHPLA
jgi:hypothetical protein